MKNEVCVIFQSPEEEAQFSKIAQDIMTHPERHKLRPEKEYLCLVKYIEEHMAGCDMRILAKFANTEQELLSWAITKFPKNKFIIVANTVELEDFFKISADLTEML